VALAALKGEKSLSELAQQFDVHANQITQWKGQLLEGAAGVFGEAKFGPAQANFPTVIMVMDMPSEHSSRQQVLLSIVVPAYNEEATLSEIAARLLAIPEAGEIVIVDDCSTDGTMVIADRLATENPRIKVAHHPVNMGKTEALKTGFALTTGQIVIVQDADLEYDPKEIGDVIAPIVEGHADVVYGSRFLVRKASRVLYFYHFLANKGLTFLSNLCTNVNMTDVETCYKAFRGEIIRNMTITSTRFGFEIEVTAKVAKLGVAIYEVPISYRGRTYEQGKKIGMKDFIAALWYIFRFNLLCSLEDSFRALPEAGSAQRAARRKRC
jgi:glycosyltransferase involved in cell wall biosynthesis